MTNTNLNKHASVLLLLMLISLACNISLGDSAGVNETDRIATQAALGATQTALAAPPLEEKGSGETLRVSFNGVSLAPPPDLTIDAQTMPADEAFEAFWSSPAHDRWLFVGYPVANDYHQAAVNIYSTQDFKAINDMAEERIGAIRAALDARPALPDGSVPFLPMFNAAQLAQAKVVFLDFPGGRGIRFLTQFGQAFWPFNNRGIVYAYIGLTDDGRYLVSALLPVAHPALEVYDDFNPPDDFYDNAETFLRDQVIMLNAQPDQSFLPSLADLDDLMASIMIEK